MISKVIIIILIISIVGILFYFLLPPRIEFNNKFKQSIKEISKIAEEKYQEELIKKTKKIEQDIAVIEEQKRDLANKYTKAVTEFEDSYKKEVEDKKEAIEKVMREQIQTIKDENNRQRIELDKQKKEIFDDYEKVVKEYEDMKVKTKKKYDEVIEEYDNTINKKKEEIKNLIEQFKKDEEARKESDFYRIVIPESFKNDIIKLKSIAVELSKPTTLYKLIWKEYYENSFNSMVGRVLGSNANKSGIYKITNVKNQMVYIGQAVNISSRWKTHIKRGLKAEEGTSNRLYTSLWEEGVENFTFQVVEFCDRKYLTEREKFYISFYNSKEYGYNSKN